MAGAEDEQTYKEIAMLGFEDVRVDDGKFLGTKVTINWSSLGSVSVEQAKKFQAELAKAIEHAENLESEQA